VDFDYPYWHTTDDTIDKVSAASLQVVGDVAIALVRQSMARRPRSFLISTWRLGDWASPSRTLAPSRAIRMPAVHRVAGSFPSWMIVGPLYCFHSWPSLEQPSGWPSRPPQPRRPATCGWCPWTRPPEGSPPPPGPPPGWRGR